VTTRELPFTPRGTVCYLTKRFPRLSETFILDEILGLEEHGVPLRLFAVADPGESSVQPDVGKVRSGVVYLHKNSGAGARDHARFLRGHATLFRRDPRRWSRTAWTMVTRQRSMALARHFLEAGGMAREMERVKGVHLHAAFAHGPASIAYYVHQLTGIPFSFAAHAKDLYLSSPEVLAMKIEESTFVLACSQSATSELRRITAWMSNVSTRGDGRMLSTDRRRLCSRSSPWDVWYQRRAIPGSSPPWPNSFADGWTSRAASSAGVTYVTLSPPRWRPSVSGTS
jgi:hypothetical protein